MAKAGSSLVFTAPENEILAQALVNMSMLWIGKIKHRKIPPALLGCLSSSTGVTFSSDMASLPLMDIKATGLEYQTGLCNGQHKFAADMSAFAQLVGLGHVLQREHRIEMHVELAGVAQAGDLGQLLS